MKTTRDPSDRTLPGRAPGRAAVRWLVPTAIAAAAGPAWAQEAARAAPPQTIVVTAQKRAEPAQSVPVSLFAATGRQLEESGISSVEQLDQLAAGVTVSNANPGQVNITMRGIGNLGGGLLSGPPVGYYIDESPMSAFSMLMPQVAFWDAERVEVLRGPQGTLFGESSMGGTLRVITAKPDAAEFSGRAQLIGSKLSGGDSGLTVRGMVNVPLVKDRLALRVVASRQELPGWIDHPDLRQKDADEGRQDDARVALRWTPTRAVTLDVSHAWQQLDSNDAQATAPGIHDPRSVDPALQAEYAASPRTSRYNLSNVTANVDLGFASLVGTASWFKQVRQPQNDLTPIATKFFGAAGVGGTITQRAEALGVDVQTQELRLVSSGDRRLDWTVGAYHKRDERLQSRSGFDFTVPLLGIRNDLSYTTVRAGSKAWSVFADVDLQLTDTLSLQAGARHFKSDNDQLIRFDTTSAIFPLVAGTERYSQGSASATSPKLGLSWKPSAQLMLYARVADGFREGGSNYQAPGYAEIPGAYGPEKIRAYEIGLKSQPLRWLTVNAAVYSNRWTNLQLSFLTGDTLFNFIQNAGRAVATGGEIELMARPMAGLRLGLNLASVDSKIDQDVYNALGMLVSKKGNRIPYSPKLQASVTAGYDFPIGDALQASASATWSHRGATYSDPQMNEATRNGKHDNLFLRLGVQRDSWGAAVFVNNATHSRATTSRSQFVASTASFGTYVPPRTFGVEFNAQF